MFTVELYARITTRGDGGRAEPPGGGEAVWRSSEHDHEDASVFGSAGLSAARTAGIEEAWSAHGVDRQRSSKVTAASTRSSATRRNGFSSGCGMNEGIFRRLYDCARVRGAGNARAREMFVPLSHRPGHAQADFGEADGYIAGKKVRFHYFCMDLPHSDGCFVKAYPAETAEAFCDGHVAAFDFFGGVPQSILYDNTRLAVAKIVKGGRAAALADVRGTAEPLPVRRPVRQTGQGQRQRQGGGAGRLCPAQLHDAAAGRGQL